MFEGKICCLDYVASLISYPHLLLLSMRVNMRLLLCLKARFVTLGYVVSLNFLSTLAVEHEHVGIVSFCLKAISVALVMLCLYLLVLFILYINCFLGPSSGSVSRSVLVVCSLSLVDQV